MRNLITDVAGVRVGQAEDVRAATGVTAVIFDRPAVASVDIRGGGPGTRETDLLDPVMTVEAVDAIVLAGGSAFGLDAASGVQAWLAEQGRGFAVRDARVPIVPGAILFDLLNGGDKNWGRYPPYRELGYARGDQCRRRFQAWQRGCRAGRHHRQSERRRRLGFGGRMRFHHRRTCRGQCRRQRHFGRRPLVLGGAVRARRRVRRPRLALAAARRMRWPCPRKASSARARRWLWLHCDATLSKAQAKRLAMVAQDGLARAIRPIHTPLDGDVVFAAATGARPLADPVADLAQLGSAAADVVARAVARAVYEATALPFPGAKPSWRDRFGSSTGPASSP